jgi:hypothetical protein
MKTISEKQLAANRANAQRSTGPRTPEGRLRASLNSRKQGLAASTFTAEGVEESGELQNLIDDAVAFYQPQNSQEQFAVERIALCQLAILRAYRLEAGALTNCFADGAATPDRISFPGHSLPSATTARSPPGSSSTPRFRSPSSSVTRLRPTADTAARSKTSRR